MNDEQVCYVTGEVIRETEKAYLLAQPQKDKLVEAWIPKSQVERKFRDDKKGLDILHVPVWIARSKNLTFI